MKKEIAQINEYGLLTDLSRELNKFLGDKSDRTVSRRTAQGFKDTFDLNLSDNMAEHFVHAGMIYTGKHLLTKNGNRTIGFLSLLTLIAFYQNGK